LAVNDLTFDNIDLDIFLTVFIFSFFSGFIFLDFSFHHQKLIFEFFVVSLHREPILTALRGKIALHLKVWSILNHGINC